MIYCMKLGNVGFVINCYIEGVFLFFYFDQFLFFAGRKSHPSFVLFLFHINILYFSSLIKKRSLSRHVEDFSNDRDLIFFFFSFEHLIVHFLGSQSYSILVNADR